jgi:hypothetical protein
MTIKDWLLGCEQYDVPETLVDTILLKRKVGDALEYPLEDMDSELLRADLLVAIACGPSRVGSTSDSDGNWSHSDGGWSLTEADKQRLLDRANAIYEKNDETSSIVGKKLVKMRSLGIGHCDFDLNGTPQPHVVQ